MESAYFQVSSRYHVFYISEFRNSSVVSVNCFLNSNEKPERNEERGVSQVRTFFQWYFLSPRKILQEFSACHGHACTRSGRNRAAKRTIGPLVCRHPFPVRVAVSHDSLTLTLSLSAHVCSVVAQRSRHCFQWFQVRMYLHAEQSATHALPAQGRTLCWAAAQSVAGLELPNSPMPIDGCVYGCHVVHTIYMYNGSGWCSRVLALVYLVWTPEINKSLAHTTQAN